MTKPEFASALDTTTRLCDCPTVLTGEYTISAGFFDDEEMIVDECVLEAAPSVP